MRTLIVILLFSWATQVSANIYDDCASAVQKGDVAAAKQHADKIRNFNSYTRKYLESAEKCLEFADDESYTYDVVIGKFVKDSEKAQIEAERKIKQELFAQIRDLEAQNNCRERKIKVLIDTINLARDQLSLENEALIEADTYAACTSLYAKDKDAASLNHMCVSSFTRFGHPALKTDPIIETLKALKAKELSAIVSTKQEIAQLQEETIKNDQQVENESELSSVMKMTCE